MQISGERMFKFILFLIVFTLFPLQAVHAQKQEEPNRVTAPLLQESPEQDFYKATVQSYKDFNEQTVKYISIALTIVSVIVTGLVVFFTFFFRRTLSGMRKEIIDGADRINDVYSKTFELLNKQADTNLRIYELRETELQSKINEANRLIDVIKEVANKISKSNERISEAISEKLGEKEVKDVQEESSKIKKQVDSMKEDLENIGGV